MARVNGRKLRDEDKVEIRRILTKMSSDSKGGKLNNNNINNKVDSDLTTWHMFAPGLRQRTFIFMFCWVCSIFTVYALLLNVQALSGDIFVNMALMCFVEAPSHLLLFVLIDRYGNE